MSRMKKRCKDFAFSNSLRCLFLFLWNSSVCHVVNFELSGWQWIQTLQHDNFVKFVFTATRSIQNLQHDKLMKTFWIFYLLSIKIVVVDRCVCVFILNKNHQNVLKAITWDRFSKLINWVTYSLKKIKIACLVQLLFYSKKWGTQLFWYFTRKIE